MKNSWLDAARRWVSQRPASAAGPRIGLALGGGFARGIAHIGILRALEQHKIPVHCIAGVSAGSFVAKASVTSG